MGEYLSPISQFPERSIGNLEQGKQSPYIAAVKLDVAVVSQEFSHPGSTGLDEIVAFDGAEVTGSYLGQLNLLRASSFCAAPPDGFLLGLDLLQPEDLYTIHPLLNVDMIEYHGKQAHIFSADPLSRVSEAVLGTAENMRYAIKPGSHTIAAYKSIEAVGPAHIYAAFAIAVPENRGTNRLSEPAILYMEDAGKIISDGKAEQILETKRIILQNVAKSCLRIGENHPETTYGTLFVQIKDILVPEGMVGSALVAMPYFALAGNAIPPEGFDALRTMKIEEWQRMQHGE